MVSATLHFHHLLLCHFCIPSAYIVDAYSAILNYLQYKGKGSRQPMASLVLFFPVSGILLTNLHLSYETEFKHPSSESPFPISAFCLPLPRAPHSCLCAALSHVPQSLSLCQRTPSSPSECSFNIKNVFCSSAGLPGLGFRPNVLWTCSKWISREIRNEIQHICHLLQCFISITYF